MSISQYNYEAYFLDYHEGRLDADATRELMDFLAMHPELKQEFENFESVSLTDFDEIKFENKESLKRSVAPVNASNFDEIAVQYIEGTLNSTLTAELLTFVKLNPTYQSELDTYKLTKLTPDTSVFFEDKNSLKRRSRRPVIYYWSAAASVAILVATYFIINTGKQNSVTIAAITTKVDSSHITTKNEPATNNTLAPQNIASNNSDIVASENNRTHKARSKPKATTTEENSAIAVIHDTATIIALQHALDILKHDTAVSHTENNFVAIQPKDTTTNKAVAQQQPTIQQIPANLNKDKKENRSVLTLASNTVKGIGKLFKRGGVEFSKYYSKTDSNKVIAYQVTLGDNRYTLARKNSLY